MIPGIESLACGPLAVPEDVMAHVVHVESSRNPYAIGVVGGRLLRQPRNLGEAIATVRMLEERGYNYSIGLAQVNRVNFARFGLDSPEAGFDVCNNLAAGAKILAECLQRHDGRWGDAFSCYYSGNAQTGYEHGYVQKVFAAMSAGGPPAGRGAAHEAIALAQQSDNSEAPHVERVPTGWDAVYAARISAPDARRVDAVSRAQPLVAGDVTPSVSPASQQRENGEPLLTDPDVKDAQSAQFVQTPESLFFEEVRRQALSSDRTVERPASLPSLAMVEGAESDGGRPESAVDSAGVPSLTQQESNSRPEDAARVF